MENSWTDVDWSLPWLPTGEQREQSLQHVKFRPVPVVAEPVLEVVDVFCTMLPNGGAHVAGFDIVESDDVAAWFVSRNRNEYRLAERLVRSAAFVDALPEVAGPGPAAATGFER